MKNHIMEWKMSTNETCFNAALAVFLVWWEQRSYWGSALGPPEVRGAMRDVYPESLDKVCVGVLCMQFGKSVEETIEE